MSSCAEAQYQLTVCGCRRAMAMTWRGFVTLIIEVVNKF